MRPCVHPCTFNRPPRLTICIRSTVPQSLRTSTLEFVRPLIYLSRCASVRPVMHSSVHASTWSPIVPFVRPTSVHLSVRQSVRPPARPPAHPSVRSFVCLFIRPSLRQSVRSSVRPSSVVPLSVRLSFRPSSVHPSVVRPSVRRPSVRPSVHPFMSLSQPRRRLTTPFE